MSGISLGRALPVRLGRALYSDVTSTVDLKVFVFSQILCSRSFTIHDFEQIAKNTSDIHQTRAVFGTHMIPGAGGFKRRGEERSDC